MFLLSGFCLICGFFWLLLLFLVVLSNLSWFGIWVFVSALGVGFWILFLQKMAISHRCSTKVL